MFSSARLTGNICVTIITIRLREDLDEAGLSPFRQGFDEHTKTVFIGDGINDAPALMAATVRIAFGQHSDVTSEAARVVIIDSSLSKVDKSRELWLRKLSIFLRYSRRYGRRDSPQR